MLRMTCCQSREKKVRKLIKKKKNKLKCFRTLVLT